ncbi:MAG: ion transporter [Deltaproteobacteria bacterium]|nr:ion transporter [Deltaproteobacteria bacterium]
MSGSPRFSFPSNICYEFWTCTCDERYQHPVKGRLRYMVSPMALVDLVAILPFYLTFIKGLDLRIVRAIRLLRLFRLFKIGRYAEAFRQLSTVFSNKKEDLAITFFVMMILLVMSSSVMFFAENEAQPDKFHSIPASMWWGVATLTTVGYGDVYPITAIGKLFGAIIALLGVGIVAMPAGIIAGGFNEALQERREERRRELQGEAETLAENETGLACVCPHCHKPIQLQAAVDPLASDEGPAISS